MSSPTRAPAGAPRTLADQLRSWPEDRLAALLLARPDLAYPAPDNSSQLASRAAARGSLTRAVDDLSVLDLTVAEAAVGLGRTTSAGELTRLVNASEAHVHEALDRLRSLVLLWGEEDTLRPVSGLGELLTGRFSRLGPSAETLLSDYGPARVIALARDLGLVPSGDRVQDIASIGRALGDRDRVGALRAEVDDQARAILDHLEREGRDGAVESTERSATRHGGGSPVDQLLARGLLVARDRRHVAVPREVAVCLREGRTTRQRADEAPALATASRAADRVDRAAAGAAFELVRHVELLLDQWGETAAPSVLRSGGLGVRELRAASELLQLDERTTALHVETAHAAGLLAVGTARSGDAAWLPTDAYDLWERNPLAERWTHLARAWLGSTRLIGLIGGRDTANGPGSRGRPVNALGPDLDRRWLPDTRRAALHQLGGLQGGSVLATSGGVESLVERMTWLRPRRPPERAGALAWVLEEAAVVGVTGLGGLAAHGRALLEADPTRDADDDADTGPGPADLLAPLLPDPVDHVLLQADLTAVAPGPLEADLARRLAVTADVESRGGATVYRFREGSLRRAFDSGWSSAEVHAFLSGASRTPVPQALTYLVDDVARRFGTVRVGAVETFLRSDDEAALAELVLDPRAESLRLRRIAPTVVVSDVPLDVVLPRLRELGAAPVVEAPDGTVRVARREAVRARTPHDPRSPQLSGGPQRGAAAGGPAGRVPATVRAIRAGDRVASSRPATGTAPSGSPAAHLALLHEAVGAGRRVWMAYLDNQGAAVERLVDPVRVEAGWLSAYDPRTEDVRSFAVHRITAVELA